MLFGLADCYLLCGILYVKQLDEVVTVIIKKYRHNQAWYKTNKLTLIKSFEKVKFFDHLSAFYDN